MGDRQLQGLPVPARACDRVVVGTLERTGRRSARGRLDATPVTRVRRVRPLVAASANPESVDKRGTGHSSQPPISIISTPWTERKG